MPKYVHVFYLCLVLLLSNSFANASEIYVYPAPVDTTVKENKNFDVSARIFNGNWQKLFVYDSEVMKRDTVLANGTLRLVTAHMGFVSFDFSDTVQLRIISKRVSVIGAGIRPLGISRQLRGDTIFVTLTKPTKFSLEINGNRYNNLLIFANAPDPYRLIPKYNRPKFHYFGPSATVHQWILNNDIQNGDTVFVDAGAVIRGNIELNNLSNVSFLGRGIVDGSRNSFRFPNREVLIVDGDYGTSRTVQDTGVVRKRLMAFNNCTGIKVEGLTLMNSPSWTLSPVRSSDISIDNIKILGYYYNTDGIDPVACKNVTINDVFIRTADDQISIKSRVAGSINIGDTLTEDILIKNAIFWPDKGHPIFVGPEAMDSAIFRNIRFDNIVILECRQKSPAYFGCIAIGAADNATIKDIEFSNITIERLTRGNLIDFRIATWGGTNFSVGKAIQNVVLNNIRYTGLVTPQESRIQGYDAARKIDGVTINNFFINGFPVTNIAEGNINVAFADNVSFNKSID